MSTSIFKKYKEDHNFGGLAVLNAGCGFAKFAAPNVVNLDAFDNCDPDVVHDLNQTPLPFADEYFDLILANHILEHLPNWWSTFEEFSRILKPNGRIEVYVPAPGTDAIHGYRDHVAEINGCSFFGTFATSRGDGNAWARAQGMGPATRLKFVGSQIFLENYWWLNVWPLTKLRDFAFKHLRNVAVEVGYMFRKVTVEEYEREVNKAIQVQRLQPHGLYGFDRKRKAV